MGIRTLKENKVITYTGKNASRSQCKKIKDNFYIVGDINVEDSGECYLIEGKYHRFNNGYIKYDNEEKKYVLVHKTTLKEGYIDYNKDTKSFITGSFSPNISKNVDIKIGEEKFICISEEIATKAGFRERYSTGTFYEKTSHQSSWFKKLELPIIKERLPYESRFVSNMTELYYNNNFHPKMENARINALGDFLEKNGITYGFEFETDKGYIPDRICYKYGLIPLRDGSIKGLEYVTIPLSGRRGLYALEEITKELDKRTRYNETCALHLHLGGLPRREDTLLAMFMAGCLVQDELLLLQPYFKRGNRRDGGKNYCKPLPINKIFSKIPATITDLPNAFKEMFSFIADGKSYEGYRSSLDNIESHPSDPSGDRKWNIHSRYFYMNFVPIIFGNKKTVEFRQHSSTYSLDKILNFLFESAMIIWFATNYTKELLDGESEFNKKLLKNPGNSTSIMKDFFVKSHSSDINEIAERNLEYVKIRKSIMEKLTAKGDDYGNNEGKFDSLYEPIDRNFWLK